MTQIYFDHEIQPKLLQLIGDAKKEMTGAVAWFTDPAVFSAFSSALQRGVKLRLLLMDDEINRNAPFHVEDLARKGAQIWQWNREAHGTMHHKFLIADSNKVMMGSYNWTVSAAGYNRENVVVFEGPDSPASDYIKEFEDLCRLAILNPASPISLSSEIVHSDVKAKLRIRIRLLEMEISNLESEKTDIETVIHQFTIQLRSRLGHFILQRMELETELARLLALKSKRRSDVEDYEQKQQNFSQTSEEHRKTKELPKLKTDEEAALKKMYREAVMNIHPDRFQDDPEKEVKANEITARLTEAYKNNDLKTVTEIWQSIQDGTIFGNDILSIERTDLLERIVNQLEVRKIHLIRTIDVLKQQELYNIGNDKVSWNNYFIETEKQLVINIEVLKKNIKDALSNNQSKK